MNETNNKVKVFWLIISFVFICAGVLSFYANDLKRLAFEEKKEESAKISEKDTLSSSQARYMLEQKFNFEVKDERSRQEVLQNDLSREVSNFILSGADPLEANRLSFTDNTSGWELKYDMGKNLLDTYRELSSVSRTAPFVFESGSRMSSAAIIISSSDDYRVKIIVEKVEDEKSKVEVYILEI